MYIVDSRIPHKIFSIHMWLQLLHTNVRLNYASHCIQWFCSLCWGTPMSWTCLRNHDGCRYSSHQIGFMPNNIFGIVVSFQSHYSDVIMSAMASQITRSEIFSKVRVTDLCEGNPPVTGGFLSQRAKWCGKKFPFDDVIMPLTDLVIRKQLWSHDGDSSTHQFVCNRWVGLIKVITPHVCLKGYSSPRADWR